MIKKFKQFNEDSDYMMDIEELKLQLAHYIEVLEHSELIVFDMYPIPNEVNMQGVVYLDDLKKNLKFKYIVVDVNNSALNIEETFTIESFNKFHDDESLRLSELSERLGELGYKLEFQFKYDYFSFIISK